jgi:hypothetical protein
MSDQPARFELTNHVCRRCFGRVLARPLPDGSCLFLCAECELEAIGQTPAVMCACGMRGRGEKGAGGLDMGLRCVANPKPSPLAPMRVIAQPAREDS